MGEGKNRKGCGREQRRTTKVRVEFSAKAQYCSVSYVAIGSRVIGLNSVEETLKPVFFRLLCTNAVFMQRQRMKDSLLRACVVVRASNMKILSRRLADHYTSKNCTKE